MYRFSEITLVHPDNLTPIKQVTISWISEKPVGIDTISEELVAFLTRDKSKDFLTDQIRQKFLDSIQDKDNNKIQKLSTIRDIKVRALKLKLPLFADPSTFAEEIYAELLSIVEDYTVLKVLNIDFTPTVVDPITNSMQKGVVVWCEIDTVGIPVLATSKSCDETEGLTKLKSGK